MDGVYTIAANFRKYPCVEDSIRDHSAYLLGAKNGSKQRYAGLTDAKDYRTAIQIIKDGGYATDTKYVPKICDIIQRYGLDKYDSAPVDKPDTPVVSPKKYVVQAGAFKYKKNARKRLSQVKALGGEFRKAFLAISDGNYVVQTGVFDAKENAEKMAAVLEKAKIEWMIKER